MKVNKLLTLLTTISMIGGQLHAAATNDTLEFFKEEAQVVTASRYAQPISESPVAITVITSEEIEASGAVNLWDLMRFAPGMDVSDSRSSDGNRADVSVRGFPSAHVYNLQVLIDGRSVYTPISGGVTWENLPVQIQDIDRIEIARGPNAALYGSNATLGTINIITKRPSTPATLAVRGALGNIGMKTEGTSFEDASSKFGFRVSQTYHEEGGFLTPADTNGDDRLLSNVGNFRGFWMPRTGTDLELMTGAVATDSLLRGSTTVRLPSNNHFEMLRLTQAVQASSVEFFVSHNTENNDSRGGPDTASRQIDSELQQHVGWLSNRVQSTWGVGYRNEIGESAQVFGNVPIQQNVIWRGFTQHAVRVTNRLTLNGAFSYESSYTGGQLTAYQAAALYHITPFQVLRLAYAAAPSLPSLFSKKGNYFPVPVVNYSGSDSDKASQAKSVEAGYQGSFDQRRLQTNLDLHYTDVSNIEASDTTTTFVPFFFQQNTIRNFNRVMARGVEAAVKYSFDFGRSVYANYTFEHLSDSKRNTLITDAVPTHKFNIGGIYALGRGFTASLNAGYKNGYLASSEFGQVQISPYWRLDSRLAYRIKRGEIYIAGQNLTRPEKVESADGLAVSRTYQIGASVEIGGGK